MSEPAATEHAWEQLSRSLFAFIRRRVADDETAADLVQEVFVRVQSGIGTLENEQKLFAWVFRIARNTVADHYRSRRSIESLDHDPAATPGDEESDLNDQVGSCLRAMLPSLPEKYREAMQLAEVDGFTQRAVGERLGLSLSGAKSRVQRGRELLRATLLSCCRVDFDRRGNVTRFERDGGRAPCTAECDERRSAEGEHQERAVDGRTAKQDCSGIVADGRSRAIEAAIGPIQTEVEARYAEELKAADTKGRTRIREKIAKEIKARLNQTAPESGLY